MESDNATNNSNFASGTDEAPRRASLLDVVGNDGSSGVGNADSNGLRGGGMTRGGGTATTTSTMVLTTQQEDETDNINEELPILRLSLRPRSNVTWEEGVVNNEGLGRKSSKRCCIWHKQRAFGESSTESSDNDDGSTSSSSSGGGGGGRAKPMAKKKNKKKMGGIKNKPKIPDYQRFHA